MSRQTISISGTLTILEDYLDNYDGIVITVSHDRYFLDRVVNRIFAFEEDGKICQYEGGYTDYVNRLAEEGKVPAGHILDAKTIRQLLWILWRKKTRLLPWIPGRGSVN